jgi:flagellar biogenesis protein FliO
MWNPDHLALLPFAQDSVSLGGTAGPDLTRYFTVCAVLILSTVGVAWGLRRLVNGNLKARAAQRSLQVIDVLGLGGKRKLAVVRCYDRTFALGLGEREVTPIAELDSVIGSDLPQAKAPGSERAAFARALDQVRASLPELGVLKPKARLEPAPEAATNQGPTRKVIRRKKAKASSAQANGSVPAAARPSATASRTAATDEQQSMARKREAQAVASAARRIAESKRRSATDAHPNAGGRKQDPNSGQQAASAANMAQAKATAESEAHQIPRMEGILG